MHTNDIFSSCCGIHELPSPFTSTRFQTPSALLEIPVVDISPITQQQNLEGNLILNGTWEDSTEQNENLASMANDIHDALYNIGFLYVKNHGVPEDLWNRTMECSRQFFDLSTEEKNRVSIRKSGHALHGYTDFFGETTDATGQVRDFKEIFDLGPEERKDGLSRPFFGPTPWPDEALLPSFRETMMEYHGEMKKLAKSIMRGIALSLDLPAEYFDSIMTDPTSIQRLLHYPSQNDLAVSKSEEEEKQAIFGISAHTDYGCLTILGQDGVGGLQVMNKNQNWIDAPPIPGTFIINIGDMIQRLTNDVYVATLHRVINTSGQERYSIPFFFDVDYDSVFEPLPNCVSESRPAKYGPIVCGVHKWRRYKASYPHLNPPQQ